MKPVDVVWIAITYVPRPIFHATDHELDDVIIARGTRVGPVAGWALSRCGKPMYWLQWSPDAGRFYLGSANGLMLPWRLVNPEAMRACRRCWP